MLERGYHLLLEKPIATTPEQCEDIVEAAERAGATFAVCHVMRYSPYSLTLQRLLDSGAIVDLVSVEHLEPIGWWHFCRSVVRCGNWRRADESSFLLLAKCVHDIDWLTHVIGRPARRVSSFSVGCTSFVPIGVRKAPPSVAWTVCSSKAARTPRRRSICPVLVTQPGNAGRCRSSRPTALSKGSWRRCGMPRTAAASPHLGLPSKLDSPTQGTESR